MPWIRDLGSRKQVISLKESKIRLTRLCVLRARTGYITHSVYGSIAHFAGEKMKVEKVNTALRTHRKKRIAGVFLRVVPRPRYPLEQWNTFLISDQKSFYIKGNINSRESLFTVEQPFRLHVNIWVPSESLEGAWVEYICASENEVTDLFYFVKDLFLLPDMNCVYARASGKVTFKTNIWM